MRSIWKGTLGFGMVAIPVKLYGAIDEKKISMNQLHVDCVAEEIEEAKEAAAKNEPGEDMSQVFVTVSGRGRIKQPRRCSTCDENTVSLIAQKLGEIPLDIAEVMELVGELTGTLEGDEILKGYPLDKEHYVPITAEEMAMLPVESLNSIQVDAFISYEPDPRAFDACYFLSPEEVGAKAFVLFTQAMEAAGVIGIAKIAIRDKEHLCSVRPFQGVLLLQTLHWADELREFSEIIPYATVTDDDLAMATKLIGAMTKDVDLDIYKDEYREALVNMISAKLEGKTIEAPKIEPKQEKNLTDALIASLNAMEVNS